MDIWSIIVLLAALTGVVSFIPEVYKALNTHHLKDVSWGMLFLFFVCSSLWSLYGYMIHEILLMASASFNILMEIILISLKVRYDKMKAPIFHEKFAFEIKSIQQDV
ncbi:hypothetical protein HYV57_03380 [Candidatus Peregrinibacteria bacterium]|nr:hypothetical protein [Candidatus Peregrinibacteria bacterium]